MEQVTEVKLYGSQTSLYCIMVHHALKLKGVAYEYVEEDLQNKSESLLELNPVHKMVPVLVVNGKPIAESLVILEFIEDTWKEPPLLPQDPCMRANIRFWAHFFYNKLVPSCLAIMISEEEAVEKAVNECKEHLDTLENGIQKDFSSGGPFIHGERPGLLDVILGSGHVGFVHLERLAGIRLLDKERTPLFCSFMDAYAELEVVKETIVPEDALADRIRVIRERLQASSKA